MARGDREFDRDDLRTRKTPDHEMPSMRSVEMRTMTTPDPTSFGGATQPVDAAPTVPVLEGGDVVSNKYHVVRRLAKGGFGAVYEGYYEINKNKLRVAIKVLLPQKEIDRASVVRFDEEVKALCSLQDPHICRVLDGGIDPGTTKPFLVMDFCEGGSLKGRQQDAPDGRVEPRQAMVWMEEAARGLLAAERNVDEHGNRAPIHHRDIKPENLLLQRGRVVVADFGAARLSGETGGVTSELVPQLWTPAYGSPEQNGGYADHRSDIYALGTTFFHLLTGQITARRFEDPGERFRHPHDPCKIAPSVPKELGDLIRWMTEPDAGKRPQSFQEVLDALAAMKQQKASKWPMRLAAALLLAAGTFVGLEVAGVIDVIGPKVILVDNDTPLRDLQRTNDQLLQRVGKLTPTPAMVWAAPLEARVGVVRALLDANRATLVDLIAEHGLDARPALPDTYDKGQSVEVLKLETTRRELAQRAVEVLVKRFDGEEFGDLVADAEQHAKAFGDCGEEVCQRQALAVAAWVQAATALLGELPDWPRSGADAPPLIEQLPELQQALQEIGALSQRADVREVREWLDERAAERRKDWVAKLREQLKLKVDGVRERVARFNERVPKASPTELEQMGSERDELQEDRASAEALQREVRGLARQHALSGQLGDETFDTIAQLSPVEVGLSGFRDMLADARYSPDAAGLRAPLRGAAEAVDRARSALEAALREAPPDRPGLVRRQQALIAARGLLDRATEELDKYEAADAALATKPVSELRESCLRSDASVQLAELEQRRALLQNRIDAEAVDRDKTVRELEKRLRDGDADLGRLRSDAQAASTRLSGCREVALVRDVQAVLASVDVCAAIVADAPAWDGGDLDAFVVAMQRLAARELQADDALARRCWELRRQAIADGWCLDAAKLWAARYADLTQRCAQRPTGAALEALQTDLAAYKALDAKLRELAGPQLGRRLLTAVHLRDPLPQPVSTSEAPVVDVTFPEGWPDESFLPPEGVASLPLRVDDPVCQELYDREFLERAQQAGLRLWYFEGRCIQDEAGKTVRPVYMVWCESADGQRAALVDVHPVVGGEIWRFWEQLVNRRSIWVKDGATMAYYMTHEEAQELASKAGDGTGVEFSLAPDDMRDWPMATPLREVPEPGRGRDVHAKVELPCADVSRGGLCYLQYGVREWTESSIVGTSMLIVDESTARLQKDAGLRLAIVLRTRAK